MSQRAHSFENKTLFPSLPPRSPHSSFLFFSLSHTLSHSKITGTGTYMANVMGFHLLVYRDLQFCSQTHKHIHIITLTYSQLLTNSRALIKNEKKKKKPLILMCVIYAPLMCH